MSLIEALNWRYATKKMNGEKVQQDKVDQIIEAARLAPTSSGLQPFRIIAVTDPELKAKIQTIAYGQQQILASSHLLIFAAWDGYTEEKIRDFFKYSNEVRGIADNGPSDYEVQVTANYLSKKGEEGFNHAARQAYIGFGVAIAQAAVLKVDTTPMEGFINDDLDALLGLKERGLRSTSILAVGHRDEAGDWLVNLKKVRRPLSQFVIEYN